MAAGNGRCGRQCLLAQSTSMPHAAIVEVCRAGLFAPVSPDEEQGRLWMDCALATFAEHRLGDRSDPRHLDAARRAQWLATATTEAPRPPSASSGEHPLWLLDGGVRAGTLAVAQQAHGNARILVTSLYVFPEHRGRGLASKALRALGAALGRRGFGFRLNTHWSWQSSVRFYLDMGLWAHMWKRELTFVWDADAPAPVFEATQTRATLAVGPPDARIVLAEARRDGDRLVMDTDPRGIEARAAAVEPRLAEYAWDALTTLSVRLAMMGWPLRRSRDGDEGGGSDAVEPESLARKIEAWEAWDRHHGWRVETPRIPGLEYASWVELEARWNREYEAYLAKNGLNQPPS